MLRVNQSTKTVFASLKPLANKTLNSPERLSHSTHYLSSNNSLNTKNPFNQTSKTNLISLQKNLVFKRCYSSLKASATYGDVFVPPDVEDYKKERKVGESKDERVFAYFMVGGLSAFGAVAGKNIVTDYLLHFAASADVLALAKVEVDMASIPEGKNVILKWRGKPITIRHRTQDEIAEANAVNLSELRDQQEDSERTKKPEWLVMLAVCTHLGCVPIGEAGDFGGWFCPCHGSHYDISGRIRKGPAPLNLEIPEYEFIEDDTKILIG